MGTKLAVLDILMNTALLFSEVTYSIYDTLSEIYKVLFL
jgi:hypothetical protein